jgi:hypothetical protein
MAYLVANLPILDRQFSEKISYEKRASFHQLILLCLLLSYEKTSNFKLFVELGICEAVSMYHALDVGDFHSSSDSNSDPLHQDSHILLQTCPRVYLCNGKGRANVDVYYSQLCLLSL